MISAKKFTGLLELLLTVFIIVIFCLSAYESGSYAFQKLGQNQGYTFILSSIISMAVSGLGLIFLFLLKLKKLEQMHREKKAMMELLVARVAAMEAASDGIGIVDSKGHLTYLNKALMALHGIGEDELEKYIGQSWEHLYTAKGRKKIETEVLPLLRQDGYWKGEAPIVKKDGAIIHAEMSLTLLHDGGFIGTARDVTDRKRSEREKEDLQTQFFHSQKMEAIGRLAGGIAHDFNNILASILGYTEFLLEDIPPNTREHNFAGQILNGSLQAQKLVEQILTFSRRGDPVKEPVDLVETVGETAAMLRATVPAGIKVETIVNVPEAMVNGNAVQISQALVNLVVNAMDAIDDKRGRLSLHIDIVDSDLAVRKEMLVEGLEEGAESLPVGMREDANNVVLLEWGKLKKNEKYVVLKVTDTGCGMSREVMEHIFEPFYTTKPVDLGTGLGLSTVHGIITAHGGAMTVESCLGEGTSFSLFFPVIDVARSRDSLLPEERLPETGEGRIMIVEDEEHVCIILSQMLERMGYESYACRDGDEAIDHIREHAGEYDLVISDYTMPSMNGGELAKEIGFDFPDLPIILLSGYGNRRLQTVAAENPNVKAVLRKPVRRDDLAREISALLRAQREAA